MVELDIQPTVCHKTSEALVHEQCRRPPTSWRQSWPSTHQIRLEIAARSMTPLTPLSLPDPKAGTHFTFSRRAVGRVEWKKSTVCIGVIFTKMGNKLTFTYYLMCCFRSVYLVNEHFSPWKNVNIIVNIFKNKL